MSDWAAAPDWSALPAPEDDGGADHLPGLRLPALPLAASDGGQVDLSRLAGRIVIFVYPMTGVPGVANPDGWDMIPGARGCTPQACAFRDLAAELGALGVGHLFGLSTQGAAEQTATAQRLHLPFRLLADPGLAFGDALSLPRFEAGGRARLKRMTLVAGEGVIEKVFYPVFPPDRNAAEVADWLSGR